MKTLRKSLLAVLVVMALLLASCETTIVDDNNDDNKQSEGTENGEITAVEFARLMGSGINLGNTMEACDDKNRVPLRDAKVYEHMWGQPITTQEIISGMREAGFKTLRIPVAWTNAMDFENGDFTIQENYLDRVEEIINYALNEDMYVIVNNHWDHGWWSMFGNPEQDVRDKAMEMYKSMWNQIADRYKGYDNRLVFEAANEELGNRLNDRTAFSPTGGTLTEDECYEMTTIINQTFIDVVRETGGNNVERFLLVKGYNTDIDKTMDNRYVMPVDPSDKLLLGVHYYTPWSYCGDTSGVGGWGTTGEVEEMNQYLAKLTKFTEQGYGIVLGEWGVLDNVGEDRYTYFRNFLSLCDKYGYVPVLWDTGGIYCRDTKTIKARNDDDDAIDDIAKLFKDRDVENRKGKSVDDIIAAAESTMALILKNAEKRPEFVFTADEAFAWIMFTSGDWSVQYSVGDQYRPETITAGIVATDAEVTEGAGTYTVALDFTGTDAGYADGFAFAALGIVNGEILFPGYVIEITEVLINGEVVEFEGKQYTTNDNAVTTRVNLYNEWVDKGKLPKEARTIDGDMEDTSPHILEKFKLTKIETLEITFDYVEKD